MDGSDHSEGNWPVDLRHQGAHLRRTFGACPVEMLEANVDGPDRTPAAYAGALADCSDSCPAHHRCLRRSR